MIHYTCDRCKRSLDAADDLRYVVKVEAFAVMEGPDTRELDDDRDHLLELHESLENLALDEADEADSPPDGEDIFCKQSYDLCPECYRRFAKNPLGVELGSQFDFSEN